MSRINLNSPLEYDAGKGENENWLIRESYFEARNQAKFESIFSQGNGFIGLRCATEETYSNQTRNTFVSGTFNKSDAAEVTELPNAVDAFALDIYVDGHLFHLDKGVVKNYSRTLNLRTGELSRSFRWETPEGKSFEFSFRRFVSLHDLNVCATEIEITALNQKAQLKLISGLDGRFTNSGAQHFIEGEKRVFEKRYLQMVQKTDQSKITFIHSLAHNIQSKGQQVSSRFEMKRRRLFMIFETELQTGKSITLNKTTNIFTTRDAENKGLEIAELKEKALDHLKKEHEKGYATLFMESLTTWAQYWKQGAISVKSKNTDDLLALRFAQYHLRIMTPAHDARCGIGAKGFSGEGYKGHSFWDTEIFILPYFIFTYPKIARSLLLYRYKTIAGARIKAKENGYKGAMYPWESAWMDDGEVTPVWGAADIVSGEAIKIWSGFIEIHITSDIAFGVWQYYQITGDEKFMLQYGYEIIFECAIFWNSRLEWDEKKEKFVITEVIGPDEYKEHIDNDAFTNYMAQWCIKTALFYIDKIKKAQPGTYKKLNANLNLEVEAKSLLENVNRIYLPQPDENFLIAQDDSYFLKKQIDLTKYKNQAKVGSIYLDYNQEQINAIQVCKQASVVMLVYLLEHQFSNQIKTANYNYYEARTLHDSSLSPSTHATLAADIGNLQLAYKMFRKAAMVDLGPSMKSSDEGIHAAAMGGIWQVLVNGFGGLRQVGNKLRVEPNLPEEITQISYPFIWKNHNIRATVTPEKLILETESPSSELIIEVRGKSVVLDTNRVETNLI